MRPSVGDRPYRRRCGRRRGSTSRARLPSSRAERHRRRPVPPSARWRPDAGRSCRCGSCGSRRLPRRLGRRSWPENPSSPARASSWMVAFRPPRHEEQVGSWAGSTRPHAGRGFSRPPTSPSEPRHRRSLALGATGQWHAPVSAASMRDSATTSSSGRISVPGTSRSCPSRSRATSSPRPSRRSRRVALGYAVEGIARLGHQGDRARDRPSALGLVQRLSASSPAS